MLREKYKTLQELESYKGELELNNNNSQILIDIKDKLLFFYVRETIV